jgi:glycosyltransferase involved in cell wall biosynthesis
MRFSIHNVMVERHIRRIRIMRIIARMNVGGPALQICGIATHLNKEQFDQLLITGYCDENEIDLLEEHGVQIPVLRISGLGRNVGLFSDLRAFLGITRAMRSFKPHIIHTHTAKAGVLGRLASMLTFSHHKRVHTFHGHLLHGYFSKFVTRLVILVESFFANHTDILISVGRIVRDNLLNAHIGEKSKFRIVPPGLELQPSITQAEARMKLGLKEDAFYIAWIGRLVAIKDPLRLITIADISKKSNLPIRFCVAGDGPIFKELSEATLENGLPIDILGWQPKIESVLVASDVVILTSVYEGTPVSLIQAQMAGKPVIATDVGSVSEVIQNQVSGYVGQFSDNQFAMLIEKLFRNKVLRDEMGRNGQEFALRNFSVERLTNDHEEIYRNLVI